MDALLLNSKVDGDSRDESDELLGSLDSDSDMPRRYPTRWFQSPVENEGEAFLALVDARKRRIETETK